MNESRGRDGRTIGDRGGEGMPVASHGRGLLAALAGLAIATAGARAQQPDATPAPPLGREPGATTTPADGAARPLSLRYRLSERYLLNDNLAQPEALVTYQVGSREKTRDEIENARGTPERREFITRTIYTERPARLGRLNDVTATVRRYDRFRIEGDAPFALRVPTPFQGLALWYEPRPGGLASLIALDPKHPIRQGEYDTIMGEVFFPHLSALFPPRPARVADTWPIGRPAARVLLSGVPDQGALDIEATLAAVESTAKQTALTAIIDISGELDFEDGQGELRARLWFVFEPVAAGTSAEPDRGATTRGRAGVAARDPELMDARGHTSKLVMSVRREDPIDREGRLLRIRTGELHMERRRADLPVGAEAGAPVVPDPAPTPDVSNAWVIYDDPEGRFHFRHPQELAVKSGEINPILLAHEMPDRAPDGLYVASIPREQVAQNRIWTDPAAHVRALRQDWERKGSDVIPGKQGWLPEKDWAPFKRRVYRFEAALRKEGARFYLDDYLVQTTRGEVFYLQAMTERDDHISYRDQVEALIQTLDPGPSAPGMPRVAPRAAAAEPAREAGPTPAGRSRAPADDPSEPPPVPRTIRRP